MRTRILFPIVVAVIVAACGTASDTGKTTADTPGALMAQSPLTNLDPALSAAVSTATYIRYESTSPAGKPIEVSGAVFLPKGDTPAGGWPVIALGHGTSGVVSSCAPTNSPNLFGSAPAVAAMLAGHRAVVMTNYQGLDGPGAAPYVDTPSSGYDIVNSVRAARATGAPLAGETVLVGISQGGRAAESASETAKSYAPELNIRGAVLLSPALEIKFAEAIRAGTLNVPDQYLILPYLVEAVRYHYPNYDYDRVIHGDLLGAAPRLEAQCTGDMTPADLALAAAATPADARFVDDAAAQAVVDLEGRTNLPKVASAVPTYIARGDADKLVSTEWSNAAVAKMCALGTPVHDEVVPGGHDAPDQISERWLGWIDDLFAGASFTSTCQR